MRSSWLIAVIGTTLALFFSAHVVAVPLFLEKWKLEYPSSKSSDRGCQLCHVQPQGGDPWNAYGFAVRYYYQEIYGFDNIELAFNDVEQANSDDDPAGITNIEEIDLNHDPGWRSGNHNSHAYKNGDIVPNQPAPFTDVDGGSDVLCFALVTANNAVAMICL